MNIKQMNRCGIVAGFIPSVAFAEVSDKVPSISIVLILGLLIGSGLILLGLFRWWLNVLLMPIAILLIAENISLWNETAMRESLIHEQGWIYFGALAIQGVFILTGAITGIIFGYKKSVR